MKKSYSYIEILIGLREEYLKNEFELEKLKQYTKLADEKIDDYYFRYVDSHLILDRDIKKSKLEKLMEFINIDKIDLTMIDKCEKDSNGNYVVKKGVYKIPTILNQNAFNEQVDKILKSSFLENSTQRAVPISDGNISFTTSGIYMNRNNYHNRCNYQSRNDIIQVQSSSTITDYILFDLLSSQISSSSLNDWQQEVIEKNINQIQEVIYPEITTRCHKLNLSIDKGKNKILLKKI